MAKSFDVLLHRHLTVCDIIIQNIPYRDGISVTDRMILDAVLQGCKLIRIAAVDSDMEIIARLNRIIKTCREKLNLSTVMGADVDLKAISKAVPVNDPIVIDAVNLGTLSRALNRAEAGMVMAVEPLVTQIAKSLGYIEPPMTIRADLTGDIKRSILTLRSGLGTNATVMGDLKKSILDIDTDTIMDATLASLCKRLSFDAAACIEMVATILGTRISHSLGRVISGITVDAKVNGTKALKLEAAQAVTELMADMAPILVKLIYPSADAILLDANVTESRLKRYRLVSDLGDMTIDDLSNMTLEDFYYIILAG